jgi:hypothetical protein
LENQSLKEENHLNNTKIEELSNRLNQQKLNSEAHSKPEVDTTEVPSEDPQADS